MIKKRNTDSHESCRFIWGDDTDYSRQLFVKAFDSLSLMMLTIMTVLKLRKAHNAASFFHPQAILGRIARRDPSLARKLSDAMFNAKDS